MSKKDADSVRIPGGTIHRIIGLLQDALNQLNADISDSKIELIGVMVHRAMSMQHRCFHTPEHIFDLADPSDPHTTLAAIFHDIVYFQVDEGFNDEIEKILKPYILVNDNTIKIREKIVPDDRAFLGTAAIFGFTPGQVLSPFAGLNEFLSALLMNSFLEGIVKDQDLLIATAGIEMTIPFRTPDKKGRFPAELLEFRIRECGNQFNLNLTEKQIETAVISAVNLSNRDVHNFAEKEPGKFLDNTWKLLPETNPELHFQGLYTIRSYSTALMKMEGFLSRLRSDTVFQQFAGYPAQPEYKKLLQRASVNITTAGAYLGIKMVSAGLLQALAELSGGDAPISFFMGEIDPEDEWSRLSYHLPDPPSLYEDTGHRNTILYNLLKIGRSSSSKFDLQNSPLSLFVYSSLNEKEQNDCIDNSRQFLNEEIDAQSFLETVPSNIVKAIAEAVSNIAFTRRERLLEIAESFIL